MSVIPRDPLLTALRAIIWFAIGILCFAAFALIVASPLALIFQSEIVGELVKEGKSAPPGFFAVLVVLLLGVAALIIMGIYFFWHLLAITDTVRDGDPFIPENARRLTRMGWLVVAIYVGGFLVAVPGAWVANIAADAGDANFEVGGDGSGIILVLVLFVLARVFRKGTEMREELEGTV